MTSGGKIYVAPGTYTLTSAPINLGGGNWAAVGSTSVSNIELYGAGNSSILQLGTNANGAVIGGVNMNHWFIHDLQVNGNRAGQSDSGASPPYLICIFMYDSSNDLLEHLYIHDCKTYATQIGPGSGDDILDSQAANNAANGFMTYGDSNGVIEGNTVNGASDVGIDISGSGTTSTNMLCTGNWVYNVNLGVSPWGLNTGIGIMAGDNGPTQNVTISNNYIQGARLGIDSDASPDANANITITGNTIVGTTLYAIYLVDTDGVTVENNTLPPGQTIYESGVTGTVTSNTTTT